MLRALTQGPLVAAASVAELRDWMRLGAGHEDALLSRALSAATQMAEQHLGAALVARTVEEVMPVTGAWQRLKVQPVLAIQTLRGIPAEGPLFTLPVEAYALDIDALGDGLVRIMRPGAAGRVRVTYQAGMAEEAGALPEVVRQGVLMLAAQLYLTRDAEGKEAVPSGTIALWRPWRRLRLN